MSAQSTDDQVGGYRLSVQQAHAWQMGASGAESCAQVLLRVEGAVDDDALHGAARALLARHDILRTDYISAPPVRTPVQVVRDEGRIEWVVDDLRALAPADQTQRIALDAREQRSRNRGPATGPGLRVVLFHLGPNKAAVLITLGAIAADAPTMHLLATELGLAYGGRLADADPVRYTQFAEWQAALRSEWEPADLVAARRAQFARLPLQRAVDGDAMDATTLVLPAPTVVAVADHAARHRVSARAVLLACWQVLLWRITGSRNVTVGTRFDARAVVDVAHCAGPFSTWAPVPSAVTPSSTLADLAAAVQRELDAITDSERLPMGVRPDDPAPWGVAFEFDEAVEPVDACGLRFVVESVVVADEPCTIKLSVVFGADRSATTLHHSAAQIDPCYARVLLEQYHALVAGMLDGSGVPADSVLLRRPDDPEQPLGSFIDERPPSADCLHRVIERQVQRTPDSIAVADAALALTYADLNARADRLAAVLLHQGVSVETPVAVRVRHSVHLVVALLGVWKAGCAYVPIDPALPSGRAVALVRAAGCELVLTANGEEDDTATAAGARALDVTRSHTAERPRSAPSIRPENAAYVMFTSGSTGRPKGVVVPHRAVAAYVLWSAEAYLTPAGGSALVHSSTGFDLTVTSLFAPLVAGRTVRLSETSRSIEGLAGELAVGPELDILKVTPSHLKALTRLVPPSSLAAVTRTLVVGGEQLDWDVLSPWLHQAPGTTVFNEYGPTEAAVGCCVHRAGDEIIKAGAVPIGRPVAGAELHVLDERLAPVPPGVPGELYIGGPGLARGYVADALSTAGRFVANPFSTIPGGRLYRTGDLVSHSPNGLLFFIGRTDDQLKVRGVRVEPGEIRAALTDHPAVTDAEVLLIRRAGRDDAVLSAYVVGDAVPDAELRGFLTERLHPGTVPETYTWLSRLPLSVNGKLDRAALRRLGTGGVPVRQVVPARSDTERAVVGHFEALLGAAPIGVDEDFFDLGGHSLLAVQLIARLNEAFGCHLPVSALFAEADADSTTTASSARGLAGLIDARGGAGAGPLVPLRGQGAGVPLFCVPSAGADVIGFRELALRVPNRPVYAVRAPELEHDGAEQTVAYLADRYAAQVHADRPATQPRHLLGWSMGGLVALEIAGRLDGTGVAVGTVVLVDCYPPELLPAYEDKDVAQEIARQFGRSPDDRDDSVFRAAVALTQAQLRTLPSYQPAPYPGRVVLVQAAAQDPALLVAAADHWRALCPGLVEVTVLPGDHYTLFQPPYVAALAAVVERVLAD